MAYFVREDAFPSNFPGSPVVDQRSSESTTTWNPAISLVRVS